MIDKNIKTKSIVEAGILSAIIVIAMLANVYIPFLGFLGVAVIPLVVAILYIRHDFKVTVLSVTISLILIFMFSNIAMALSFLLLDIFSGLVLGYCIKHGKSSFSSVFFVTIAYSIGMMLSFFVVNKLIYGAEIRPIIDEMVKIYNATLKQVLEQYTQMGASAEKLDVIKQSMQYFTADFIMKTIPGYLIITLLIFSFINYKLCSSILKKLNMNVNEIKKFKEWHLDDKIAALTIGLMAIGVILNTKNIPFGGYVLHTSTIVGKTMFEIIGISVVVFFLSSKYKLSKYVMILIILFSFLLRFNMIYFVIGMIDSLVNFRKLYTDFQENK